MDGASSTYFADTALQQQSTSILETNCTSCHGSVATGGLSDITNVDHLLGGKYILPGNANSSLIIQVVVNGSMPPGKPLTNAEIDTMKSWINSFTSANPNEPPPAPPGTMPLRATFTSINANILNRCIVCHSSSGIRPQSDFNSYAAVIASGKVIAGSSATSEMYTKTLNYSMPQGPYDKLSYAELAVLKTWIDSGAPND